MLPDQTMTEPPSKRQRKGNPEYPGGLASLNRGIPPPTLGRSSSSNAARLFPMGTVPGGGVFAESRSSGKKSIEGGGGINCPTNPYNFIDLTGEEPDSLVAVPSRISPEPKQKQLGLRSGEDSPKALPSPFQLTSIRDLPASENADTVGIKDILGDVMIKEAWIFNFIVDLDWVM